MLDYYLVATLFAKNKEGYLIPNRPKLVANVKIKESN